MLAWKTFQSILGALEPRERTWHGERPKSATVASQNSVWRGESPGWGEWWGTGLVCSPAMTQNLHAALICLNTQGWAQFVLLLIQTWLPGGHTSQVFLCCPEHTGSEAGALAGEEEVFPLSPHICTDPPSTARCPDSLRLKKGTPGKTQFRVSEGNRVLLLVLLYSKNQAFRSSFLHGSSYIFLYIWSSLFSPDMEFPEHG